MSQMGTVVEISPISVVYRLRSKKLISKLDEAEDRVASKVKNASSY